MRTIKFRGKRIDNRNWVYGDLIHYDSGQVAILKPFSEYGYEATEIINRDLVDPATVGQYTGLTDLRGKEIYEGDCLRIGFHVYLVVWNELELRYGLNSVQGNNTWFPTALQGKVIGNIHEEVE